MPTCSPADTKKNRPGNCSSGRFYNQNCLVIAQLEPLLNRRRQAIKPTDVAAIYDFSFWAHYELVTIHPWADGNGRTSRLLMNLLQWEFGVLPTKVLKEDKDEITTEIIVSHFDFTPTTAKRYLRQLTMFGYLEAHGGNKNRTYNKKHKQL